MATTERRRATLVLGVCSVLVLGLLTAAVLPLLRDRHTATDITDVSTIGSSAARAGCRPVRTSPYVTPSSGNHVPTGRPLRYPVSPPSDGLHWGVPMQPNQYRTFYTSLDRPAKEQLVHSLEHGYTIIWYDESVANDSSAVADLKDVASAYPPSDYVLVAPWTRQDGTPFPDSAHVALTHWTGPDPQAGVWEYCDRPSGEVVQQFVTRYPKKNSPEPNAR